MVTEKAGRIRTNNCPDRVAQGRPRPGARGCFVFASRSSAASKASPQEASCNFRVNWSDQGESFMPTPIRWTRTAAVIIAVSFLAVVAAPRVAQAQKPPEYKVDPFWPKRLPNKWSMQQIVDIYVDKEDH